MFRFLLALAKNALKALLTPIYLRRRRRAAPRCGWLRLDVKGAVVEIAQPKSWFQRGDVAVALESVRQAVELAGQDPRVKGLLVVLHGLQAGNATAEALRSALLRVKETGKRLACFLPHGGGTLDYFVAAVADVIILGPEAPLFVGGFAVETPYFKKALARLGIMPEIYAQGRYKTAAEPLLLESMSEGQREQVSALLDVAWDELLGAIASGRGVDRETAARWVHQGLFTAEGAESSGLVDARAYEDELLEKLTSQSSALPEHDAFRDIFEYAARRRFAFTPLFRQRYLAVVEVHGTIVEKPLGPMPAAIEESIQEALKQAREDPDAKGVLLHINSRGGGAGASDRLRREVELLARKKPCVAYFSDAAASGGYMIGAAAHSVVARPTTVTGSIGVIAARLPLGPLLGRLGIVYDGLKRGDHADFNSRTRPFDDEERRLLEAELKFVYDGFIASVARSRKRDPKDIAAAAGGRVWSGKAALDQGLVDRLGGFDLALDLLRDKLEDKALAPKWVGSTGSFADRALHALSPRLKAQLFPSSTRQRENAPLETLSDVLGVRERLWAYCPVAISTRLLR